MILTLKRKLMFGEPPCTIGELYVNGAFRYFTLEDQIRPAGQKIKHQTAIPAGTYQVVMGWSNRFQRIMPRLVNVPMFEGILIHAGNDHEDTSGCILVGRRRGEGRILESRAAFGELYGILAEASKTEKITIEILNPPNLPANFRNTAPPRDLSTATQGKVAPAPQKSKIERSTPQIPAFPVSVPPGLSPSDPAKVPAQAPKQAAESLKSGNTLPVSLVTIQTACELFFRENGFKLLLWLTLSVLIALLYHEWRDRQAKRKVR